MEQRIFFVGGICSLRTLTSSSFRSRIRILVRIVHTIRTIRTFITEQWTSKVQCFVSIQPLYSTVHSYNQKNLFHLNSFSVSQHGNDLPLLTTDKGTVLTFLDGPERIPPQLSSYSVPLGGLFRVTTTVKKSTKHIFNI
jgi:hypothetical protein